MEMYCVSCEVGTEFGNIVLVNIGFQIHNCVNTSQVAARNFSALREQILSNFTIFWQDARKKAVFWDVAPYRFGVNRRFGGTYRLHLQGRKKSKIRKRSLFPTFSLVPPVLTVSSLADFLIFPPTLKMEVIRSSETLVNTTSTRCHIPENCFLHSHCREYLKSYVTNVAHCLFVLRVHSYFQCLMT
jgi:hypothetical protein